MDAESRLRTYAERADARLDAILPEGGDPPDLYEAMRYAVLGPGKRIRPALCMASAAASGSPADEALDAGCAIELVHCFSLVHDDLPSIDDDALRRGRPTLHVQFDEGLAVLAGDALFALAFEVLASAASRPEVGHEALRLLAIASGPQGLGGGEVADVRAEAKSLSKGEIQSIHRRKTGALIQAACEIGAVFGGADQMRRSRIREYGARAGLAFQIADDLLNELSSAAVLGKSAGSDRARNKATYPAIWGLEGARAAAETEKNAAVSALDAFGPEADDLRVFARYVVERLS